MEGGRTARRLDEGNGQDRIRTCEGVSQWIYSPPRLATSVPTQIVLDFFQRVSEIKNTRLNRGTN